MSIKHIDVGELRRMKDKGGLVLQGCGGNPQEWLDGINELLTDEGILQNGSKFENIFVFKYGELINILFPFEDNVQLDVGKLAVWRLYSHGQFGGTWLSDYVPNCFGGFTTEQQERQKPNCPLIGQDGNIFNLMGIASKTLKRIGMSKQAGEMYDRIRESGSYDEALNIIGEYVNITSAEDSTIDEDEGMGICL